ncbi:unnamed protein product [Lota lota]
MFYGCCLQDSSTLGTLPTLYHRDEELLSRRQDVYTTHNPGFTSCFWSLVRPYTLTPTSLAWSMKAACE